MPAQRLTAATTMDGDEPAQRLPAATRPPLDHACAAAYGRDHVYQSSLRSGYDCDTNPRVPSLRGGFLAATTSRSLTRLRGGFRPRLVPAGESLRGGLQTATAGGIAYMPARRLPGRDLITNAQHACAAAFRPRHMTGPQTILRSGLRLRPSTHSTHACAAAYGCDVSRDSHVPARRRSAATRTPVTESLRSGSRAATRTPGVSSLRSGFRLRREGSQQACAAAIGCDRTHVTVSLRGGFRAATGCRLDRACAAAVGCDPHD